VSGNFFEAIRLLFPRARAFELFADNAKRKFFKGLAALPEDVRREAELAWLDLFPFETRRPEKWEKVFALLFTEAERPKRRSIIDSMWKTLAGDQSTSFLESMLQRIDPRIRVVENVPVSNPRYANFALISVCGYRTMRCGHRHAVCAFRLGHNDFEPTIIRNDATTVYDIPEDSAYWENCFFVCDSVFRSHSRNILYVESLRVSATWKNYVEYIILKTKPAHATAIVFIDWAEEGPAKGESP